MDQERRPPLATITVQKAINRVDLKKLDRANVATGNFVFFRTSRLPPSHALSVTPNDL